jgi:hypothetical protein
VVLAALLAAVFLLLTLRERSPAPPASDEIDDRSKEALREILRQEEE